MLKWSQEQVKSYNNLLQKVLKVSKWKSVANACFDDAIFFKPDDEKLLKDISIKLKIEIPKDLLSFWRETNGVNASSSTNLVMKASEALCMNKEYRSKDFLPEYMPFQNLLIFGEAGNGDLFFYPISKAGKVEYSCVFKWDHETDSRSWYALSLKDFFCRYSVDRG